MKLIKKLQQKIKDYQLSSKTPEKLFANYYKKNKWGDPDSKSGKGSNLNSTEAIRQILPQLFAELNVQKFLDMPCGDFYWMSQVKLDNIKYIGADIVPDLILNNNKFSSKNIKFQVLNIAKDPLPEVDLILTRDCLVHLKNNEIIDALQNVKNSNSKYFLSTNYPNDGLNIEIKTGDWRPINLCRPPFSLPDPLKIYQETFNNEKGQQKDKMLYLWRIEDFREF